MQVAIAGANILVLKCSQVSATHLKIGHLYISVTHLKIEHS